MYHCGVSIRHHACSSIAYATGIDVHSHIENKTYHYSGEKYVDYGVCLPEQAPEEFQNISVLANSIEKKEFNTRSDAQMMRSFIISFPNDFTDNQAIETAKNISSKFASEGMCAVWSVHRNDASSTSSGIENLHTHILCSMRGISSDGEWMPKQKSEFRLDCDGNRIPKLDSDGNQVVRNGRLVWERDNYKLTDWDTSESTLRWRKDVEVEINKTIDKYELDIEYVDCRSFADQGIERIPKENLPMEAYQNHDLEIYKTIKQKNDLIEKVNIENETINNKLDTVENIISSLERIKNFLTEIPARVLAGCGSIIEKIDAFLGNLFEKTWSAETFYRAEVDLTDVEYNLCNVIADINNPESSMEFYAAYVGEKYYAYFEASDTSISVDFYNTNFDLVKSDCFDIEKGTASWDAVSDVLEAYGYDKSSNDRDWTWLDTDKFRLAVDGDQDAAKDMIIEKDNIDYEEDDYRLIDIDDYYTDL